MMQCPNCGSQISDTSHFCSVCGTRLHELPSKAAALAGEQRPVPEKEQIVSGGNRIPVSALPFSFHGLEKQYGQIRDAEMICPGVYYIAAKINKKSAHWGAEYLAVTEDSPAISSEARSYGTPLPMIPRVYLYDYDYSCEGRHIVEYEAHKYLAEHGFPLPDCCSLAHDKSFGMDVCPAYFGEFPIPAKTPWGPALRHICLRNGLYWLETAEIGWVLAVAYPLCSELWEDTLALAVLTEYDRENGIDHTCGYRFYDYRSSCLPLYEMLDFEEDTWGPKIDKAALHNAILKFFPHYGSGDGRSGPEFGPDKPLLPSPDAGTDFYHFS